MKIHSPSYKRNYSSKKPRKTRKDKGFIRRDFARLLSSYYSDEDEDGSDDGDTDEIPVDVNGGDGREEEGGSDSGELDICRDLQEEEEEEDDDERIVKKRVENTAVTADECNNDNTHVISKRSLLCVNSTDGDCCDNGNTGGGRGIVGKVCNGVGVREGCDDSGYGGGDIEMAKERITTMTALDNEG